MARKTWIETSEGAETSEAIRGPKDGFLPSKERQPAPVEKRVDEIIKHAVCEIESNQKGRQYRATEELRACENEVNFQALAILRGESLDFEPLREACTRWVDTARKTAEPIPALLFSEV